MACKTDSLDIYAQAIGYQTEEEMLKELYTVLGMSTTAIARIVGCRSQSNIRVRLMRFNIPLRKRGGYMGRGPGKPRTTWADKFKAHEKKETTQDGIRSDSTNDTSPQVCSGEEGPILPRPPV